MKANEINLNRFLAQPDTQFIIPVYQRNYDWTQAQCRQLLDDILTVGSDDSRTSHFIGGIVFIHDDVYSASSVRELSIIDGQQRLTTVTLLYVAIYVLAKEMGDTFLVSRIQEKYLINKHSQESAKLKLRPTENNDRALQFLLRSDPDEEYPEYSRLIENYRHFRSRLTVENLDVIQRGLNKLIFVEISLEREKDDPQKIFESLNSTGLELSQSDLIRNYILMGLKHDDQVKIYDRYWKYIETHATQADTNINRVSDFIRDFLTFANREIPNKSKVYQEYKKKYPLTDMEALAITLGKMKRYVGYYNRLINPNIESDHDIRQQLSSIHKLEVNVAFPFLMEVWNDYALEVINKQTLIEVLELVQSFVWRRFIIGLPTNALNKIFMRLYEDVIPTDYIGSLQRSLMRKRGTQRFPRDQEVIDTLRERDMYGIQSRNRNYFLERLENFENREPVRIDDNPNITVEHIFPQNPESRWRSELSAQDYSLMRDKYLHTISNLTLSGNNGPLGNKYFTEKRDMNNNGGEQGYYFSRLWLNKHLAQLDKWGKTQIEQRFEQIAERFLRIWKSPSAIEFENENNIEINIFDADDPTGKKLDYIIFMDQKITVRSVTEMYNEVIRLLFDLNPEAFINTPIYEKLNVSTHKEKIREPISLGDSYFFEQHMSSRVKFDRIKYVLTTLELEDELLVKYM